MMTIVTHHTPDLDAITSSWMLKRFLPNWQEAQVKFVPAGKTLDGMEIDSDPHVWHVDTGLGKLDHHQSGDYTCAAKKVFEYLQEVISVDDSWHDEALKRITDEVTFIDHFKECTLPNANNDYHVFHAAQIIDGFKVMFSKDEQILEAGFTMLDAIYKVMQEKVWAEEIIEQESKEFTSKWGKAIAFETLNDAVLKIAQKQGYIVVVRKDPKKYYVRMKGRPDSEVDFTQVYEEFKKLDPTATWYLHPSKKILLNGTVKNPDMRPTSLSLDEIIEVLK